MEADTKCGQGNTVHFVLVSFVSHKCKVLQRIAIFTKKPLSNEGAKQVICKTKNLDFCAATLADCELRNLCCQS